MVIFDEPAFLKTHSIHIPAVLVHRALIASVLHLRILRLMVLLSLRVPSNHRSRYCFQKHLCFIKSYLTFGICALMLFLILHVCEPSSKVSRYKRAGWAMHFREATVDYSPGQNYLGLNSPDWLDLQPVVLSPFLWKKIALAWSRLKLDLQLLQHLSWVKKDWVRIKNVLALQKKYWKVL